MDMWSDETRFTLLLYYFLDEVMNPSDLVSTMQTCGIIVYFFLFLWQPEYPELADFFPSEKKIETVTHLTWRPSFVVFVHSLVFRVADVWMWFTWIIQWLVMVSRWQHYLSGRCRMKEKYHPSIKRTLGTRVDSSADAVILLTVGVNDILSLGEVLNFISVSSSEL